MGGFLGPVEQLDAAERERGLRLVLYDGLASMGMASLASGIFLTAAAVHLGGSNLIVGLLAAIPFLAQLGQLPSVLLVERLRRRRLISVLAGAVARLSLLGVAFGMLLPPDMALTVLLGGLTVYCLCGSLSGCAWNSWMRDLVPGERLGVFFGNRLMLITLGGAVLSYAGGIWLDRGPALLTGGADEAFALLFLVAVLLGVIGSVLIARTPEPAMGPPMQRTGMLDLFRGPLSEPNFRRLMGFLGAWSFAANLAAPFMVVYMLTLLKMTMVEIVPLLVVS